VARGGLTGTPASTGGGVKKWEETLQRVLVIPLQESRWVLKGCLGLGFVTRWCWEEEDWNPGSKRSCLCSVS